MSSHKMSIFLRDGEGERQGVGEGEGKGEGERQDKKRERETGCLEGERFAGAGEEIEDGEEREKMVGGTKKEKGKEREKVQCAIE